MGCAASIREALSKNNLTVDRNHFYFAKVVGSGGFGTVFSAMHVDYNSWFAIKQINKVELLKHKSGADMIMGELNAWKKVGHHPYISDLHFAFQDRSYCYFVMDLLTGADLRYYVKKRIILTEPELAFLVAAMSSALNHLHRYGILHRDIKPENIVFDHEGFPYLTDFGVSYICDEDMTCSLSSGTKQYLAPEVFCKAHVHGPASDFWSLGVMIYEIMYGKRPFDKHVPREYINHVEFETEQDLRRSYGSVTPIHHGSPVRNGSTSPHTGRGFSPFESDTVLMSGAMSLSNTKSPSPASRRMSPVSGMQHSKSEQNVSARVTTSLAALAQINASTKADVVKLPEVSTGKSKKDSAKKKNFPAMGSLSAASSLVQLLRQEEEAHRGMGPGKAASKYSLPGNLPFIKASDTVEPFEGLLTPSASPCRSVGPETDDRGLNDANRQIEVSDFTETGDSANSSHNVAPALPSSLKVTLPLTSMYHEKVSPAFLSFLEGILDIRPKYRFGGLRNYDQLKNHEWFTETQLSWANVEDKTAPPPFVPNREQIQFDMASKHRAVDIDDLDTYRLREFISNDKQKLFDDYHHIANEYKELFPALSPQKAAPGVTPLKCR